MKIHSSDHGSIRSGKDKGMGWGEPILPASLRPKPKVSMGSHMGNIQAVKPGKHKVYLVPRTELDFLRMNRRTNKAGKQ